MNAGISNTDSTIIQIKNTTKNNTYKIINTRTITKVAYIIVDINSTRVVNLYMSNNE